MEPVNFFSVRAEIIDIAKGLFDKIMSVPIDIRGDDEDRSGIQVFMREIGSDNILFFPVCNPTETVKTLVVEKAVRSATLNHYSSQNSAYHPEMKFAGSVTIWCNGVQIQASVSGLKEEEDVAIAIYLLAHVSGLSLGAVIEHVKVHGGLVPACLSMADHYLQKIITWRK